MKEVYSRFKFVENKGLYFDDNLLIDADINVIRKKCLFNANTGNGTEYLVQVTYTDERAMTERWLKDLKRIDFWSFEVNDALLDSEKYNLIIFKLLYEANLLTAKTCIENTSGMRSINGKPTFFLGQHILLPQNEKLENVVFTSNFHMNVSEQFKAQSVSGCLNMLPGVTELLFYGALYAIVKPFLNEMKINGGFVNALVGPPGHLKTSLIRKFALWLEDREQQEIGFYLSRRNQTILDSIESISGQNFLIDDLHRVANRNENLRQQQRLEAIARHVNSVGRCANLFITGESLADMGVFSCIDRTLQITISKMSSKEITTLKLKMSDMSDEFMTNVAFVFAKRLMENYSDVLADIKDFYDKNVNVTNQNEGHVTRIQRYAMFLKMTRFLFCKYCFYFERGDGDEEAFEAALKKQIDIQYTELQRICENKENSDYAIDLFEIINKEDDITLIHDSDQYFCSDDTCCMKGDRVYFTTKALERAFLMLYGRYVSTKDIVHQLHIYGILETEPGSRGKQKNFKGKKHYVISIRVLLYYLLSKDYPLPVELMNMFGVKLKR